LCTAGDAPRHRHGALGTWGLDGLVARSVVELAGHRRPVIGLDWQGIGLGIVGLRQTGQSRHGAP